MYLSQNTHDPAAVIHSPLASRASRKPSARSTASMRSTLVSETKCDPHARLRYAESGLEQKVLFLLLTHADIVDVWDQPVPQAFVDRLGKVKHHTFDYLATYRSGYRLAIAVKPHAKVVRRGFEIELKQIRKSLCKSFADDIALVTDRDLCPIQVYNARLTYYQTRCATPSADHALRSALSLVQGTCSIADWIAVAKSPAQGFGAALRLIQMGVVQMIVNERLSPSSLIRVNEGGL